LFLHLTTLHGGKEDIYMCVTDVLNNFDSKFRTMIEISFAQTYQLHTYNLTFGSPFLVFANGDMQV
jgi:hypothetical protein